MPNGDFENVLPTWSKVSGSAPLTFPVFNTNLVAPSRCAFIASGDCTLQAPAPVTLQDQRYELSFDLYAEVFGGWTCDVDLVAGGQTTRLRTLGGVNGHQRAAFWFQATAGTYDLQLTFTNRNISGVGGITYVDNVSLTPAPGLRFNLEGARQRGASARYVIEGTPFAMTAEAWFGVNPGGHCPVRVAPRAE